MFATLMEESDVRHMCGGTVPRMTTVTSRYPLDGISHFICSTKIIRNVETQALSCRNVCTKDHGMRLRIYVLGLCREIQTKSLGSLLDDKISLLRLNWPYKKSKLYRMAKIVREATQLLAAHRRLSSPSIEINVDCGRSFASRLDVMSCSPIENTILQRIFGPRMFKSFCFATPVSTSYESIDTSAGYAWQFVKHNGSLTTTEGIRHETERRFIFSRLQQS